MPFFLSKRDTGSTEWMDDPACDRQALFNTYRQFGMVNAFLAGWKPLFERRLMPVFSNPAEHYSLLDIGFGGGDIPANIARWAGEHDISLRVTAIETDRRALEYVQDKPVPENLTFLHCSSSELASQNRQYDVVISNHLIHHLSNLISVLQQARKLSTKLVLFNDIERSDMGYALFNIFSRPLFRSSFITHDGLASIKRSYTKTELQNKISSDWQVERRFPFRLLLSYRHEQ